MGVMTFSLFAILTISMSALGHPLTWEGYRQILWEYKWWIFPPLFVIYIGPVNLYAVRYIFRHRFPDFRISLQALSPDDQDQ